MSETSPLGLPNLARRIAGSTFLLTVALVVAFEVAVSAVDPLRFVNHTGLTGIRQNVLVTKLPGILESREDRDVLMLGSSTILFPTVRCDDELHGRRARWDSWFYRNILTEYTKADYLESLVGKRFHHPIKVWNATVAASLVSDQYLIVKKYLASGKRPKLVIITLAPREFMDNIRKDAHETDTYSLLADFTSLPEMLMSKNDPWKIADAGLGMAWTFYKNRADYRTFIETSLARRLGHPATVWESMNTSSEEREKNRAKAADEGLGLLSEPKPDYTPRPNTLEDLDEYRRTYLPINHKKLASQSTYLHRLLGMLKQEKIATIVVDIPLMPENYALLPPAVLQTYRDVLRRECAANSATLVSPGETMHFTRDDYQDSVHMTASGGKKLLGAIAGAVNPEICDTQSRTH